jgi:hypothetical protein
VNVKVVLWLAAMLHEYVFQQADTGSETIVLNKGGLVLFVTKLEAPGKKVLCRLFAVPAQIL